MGRSLGRVAAALGEQLAYTGAFFVVQLVAARWLGTDDFALFASLYSVVILLSLIHGCAVFDSLLLFGKQGGRLTLSGLLTAHAAVAAVLSVATLYLIILVGLSLPLALLFVLACVSFALYWTARALAIVKGRTGWLIVPPLVQTLLVLLAQETSARGDIATLLGCIVVGSGVPALFIYRHLNRGVDYRLGAGRGKAFISVNLLAQVIFWGLTHGLVIYFFLRGAPEQAGSLRISLTLLLPAQYFCIALSNQVLPQLIGMLAKQQRRAFVSRSLQLLAACVVLSALYAGALALGVGEALHSLFGKSFGGVHGGVLLVLPVAFALVQVGRTLLKASGDYRLLLFCTLLGLVVVMISEVIAQPRADQILVYGVVSVALALGLASGRLLRKINVKDGE
ncbi:polysaccharide biosynthesis protein [Pseudomonas sp. No.117]